MARLIRDRAIGVYGKRREYLKKLRRTLKTLAAVREGKATNAVAFKRSFLPWEFVTQ
jgi:hypothetical protein